MRILCLNKNTISTLNSNVKQNVAADVDIHVLTNYINARIQKHLYI